MKGFAMKADSYTGVDVLLDAASPRRVAAPLLPEFAIVSTLVLIAAPIVLVGATAAMALRRSLRATSRSRTDN